MNVHIEETAKRAIKFWSAEDRPREKLLLKGRQVLSNTELLAILIGTGTRNSSALDLARRLLAFCNDDLNMLAGLSPDEITKVGGIGQAKAVNIIAAIELGGRRQAAEVKQKPQVTSSSEVFRYFSPRLTALTHEEMWILLLNRANRIIGEKMVSEGGISGTVADPRRIFKTAIDRQATGIILVHNHPSGNLKPSEADKRLTRNLAEGGKILDIALLDHLIIAQGGYYSFADEGQL